MTSPKPIMRLQELRKMGFPAEFLQIAYLTKGQTFAQKMDPTRKNSPIIFETAGFEEWRMRRLQAENRALPR